MSHHHTNHGREALELVEAARALFKREYVAILEDTRTGEAAETRWRRFNELALLLGALASEATLAGTVPVAAGGVPHELTEQFKHAKLQVDALASRLDDTFAR